MTLPRSQNYRGVKTLKQVLRLEKLIFSRRVNSQAVTNLMELKLSWILTSQWVKLFMNWNYRGKELNLLRRYNFQAFDTLKELQLSRSWNTQGIWRLDKLKFSTILKNTWGVFAFRQILQISVTRYVSNQTEFDDCLHLNYVVLIMHNKVDSNTLTHPTQIKNKNNLI